MLAVDSDVSNGVRRRVLPKILQHARIVSYKYCSKAGKFDVVFDNNVRKLEEIQPVVQGIKASNLELGSLAAAPIFH